MSLEQEISSPSLADSEGQLIARDVTGRFELRRANILRFPCSSIVSPCDRRIASGLSRTICDAAGPRINVYFKTPRGINAGDALATPSFNLKSCHHIIHTHVAHYDDRRYSSALVKQLLANCYRNCIVQAIAAGATEIAFPVIGTGWKNYPQRLAARIAVNTVRDVFRHPIYGAKRRAAIKRVVFLVWHVPPIQSAATSPK